VTASEINVIRSCVTVGVLEVDRQFQVLDIEIAECIDGQSKVVRVARTVIRDRLIRR